MNVIPEVNMVHSDWMDIIGAGLNVPEFTRVQVRNFFQNNEANTPYQLIGRLLIASYPANAEGLNMNGHNNFLRRYRGDNQPVEHVIHIQRALYYVVYVCNLVFHLQLPYFDFDEFIDYIDGLPNAQPETTPEPPNAQPETNHEIPGGNKRKRSAKRKSSKKRTTRSKKRSLK